MRRLLSPAVAIVIVALAVAVAVLAIVLLIGDDGPPAAEPVAEAAVEPTAEPVAEPVAEAAAEPTAELVADPVAESPVEPIAESTAADSIAASEASNYVGSRKTVCGQVASATFAANDSGQPTFLNLDRPYPDQLFTIVIWGRNRDRFAEPPEILYGGIEVCVSGLISQHQGQPQIEVASPAQMAIGQ